MKPNDYTEWFQAMFKCMEDGGRWAVPRCSLVFERRGNGLVLIGKMREQDHNRPPGFRKRGKLKVSNDKSVNIVQLMEYWGIRDCCEAAGIPVSSDIKHDLLFVDMTELLEGKS